MLAIAVTDGCAQGRPGIVIVEVRSKSRPVEQAEISAGDVAMITEAGGEAVLELPAGAVELTIERFGFKTQRVRVTVLADSTIRVTVDLEPEVVLKQEITVTATRTEQRIEDEPLHVEVLDQDEVEEKALMTPGGYRDVIERNRRSKGSGYLSVSRRCECPGSRTSGTAYPTPCRWSSALRRSKRSYW